MATFASDFDKYSVPTPTYSTQTPTAPGTGQYDAFKSYGTTSGQAPVSDVSAGLQSLQGTLQKNAGLSSSIDPNLTQDALAGNLAMAQRQSLSMPQYNTQPMAPTSPTSGQSGALSSYLANSTSTLANWKPEAVQGAFGGKDNSYQLTRSGLSEPDPRQFANQTDYKQALAAYAKLSQQEELMGLQSDTRQFINSQNAYQKSIDEMQRRTMMIEGEQKELGRQNAIARNNLANRLAARGISENTDSSAQQQFAELDRMNAEAQQAVRTAAALDSKEFQTAEEARMSAALKMRVQEIQAEQEKLAAVEQGAEKNAADMLMLEKKKEDYDSKMADRDYDNMLREREVAIKEGKSPAEIALIEARAGYTGAQTDYLSGAKTDLTNSQIAKTDAQTNRITTLLPAELAKMNAMTTKLLTKKTSSGGGGVKTTISPEELEAVYRLNGGKAPTSEKTMAQLVNQVRTVQGNVDNLVEVQNQTKANSAAAVKAATNAVSGDSSTNTMYDIFGAK